MNLYRYSNQVHTKHDNLFNISLDQNRNKAENKCSSLQRRYLFTCLSDYKALFVSVQDSTCLRMPIPAYCFNICLLIEKSNEKTCRNISEKEKQSKYFSMNNGCNKRVLGGRGDQGSGTVVSSNLA